MQLFLRTYEISKHDGFQREPTLPFYSSHISC